MSSRRKSYISLSHDINKLTTTLSRDSMEVRTPVFSNQGLALCDLPSPTDMLGPIDYRSVCRRVKSPMPREVPSPRRRSNDAKDAYPPTGRSPPSPSGSSIGDATSTNTHEQNVVISHASSSPNEAEPGLAGPLFRHPRRERETRRVSLVLRPASSGGPALQTLSPPPVKVNLAVRRGTTVPSRLPPAPPPRRRSHRSIERSQLPYESAHNVSEPGAPTSITPEEGLIQLQARTQQTDSNTRLGYRRSFKHIRGLSPRTRPTSALPQISTVSVPISTHPDYSDDAAIVTISEGSLIGLITQSSSDESGSLSTPPDDAIPDITITRSRKGSDAPSDPLHFSSRARAGKYASSFLDFEPGTPRSPLSPATQSPFSVAQSQLLTCCGSSSPKCVDGPTEQSDADTSTNSDEEQEQGDWGARTGASPIRIPGVSDSSMRGSKARPSLLRLGIPYIESGNSVYIRDANVGGSGITGAYHTRAVGQSQRRRKSGARRSHRPRSKSGTTTSLRSYNMASGETISAIRGVGVFIEISSRMTDRRRSPSRMV